MSDRLDKALSDRFPPRLGRSQSADRRASSIPLFLLIVGAILRLSCLSADPYCPAWKGYVTDEGRWVEQARNLVLFSSLSKHEVSNLHFAFAPLYQLVQTVAFWCLGVSYWSARLYSALCGIGAMCLFLGCFRKRLSPLSLTVGLTILALDLDLICLSRLAIPEAAALFWESLAFTVIISDPKSLWRAALSGVVVGIAVATKVTVAPVALIFLIVSVLDFEDGMRLRPQRAFAYLAPLVLFGLIGAFATVQYLGVGSLLHKVEVVWNRWHPGGIYLVVASFAENKSWAVINALMLAGSVCLAAYLLGSRWVQRSLEIPYWGSLIWATAWLSLPMFVGYFPDRYAAHALVPLGIHVSIGISLIPRLMTASAHTINRPLPAWRRWVAAFLLVLPVTIMLMPLITVFGRQCGFNDDRLRYRVFIVAVLTVVGSIFFLGRNYRRPWFFASLVMAVCAWTSVLVFGNEVSSISRHASDGIRIACWSALATGAFLLGAACWTCLRQTKASKSQVSPTAAWLLVASVVVVLCGRLAPGALHRTYTMMEVSSQLQVDLQEASSIRSRAAETLFINTDLPYNRISVLAYTDSPADVMLCAFQSTVPPNQDYLLTKEYFVNLYTAGPSADADVSSEPTGDPSLIRLYRLADNSPN